VTMYDLSFVYVWDMGRYEPELNKANNIQCRFPVQNCIKIGQVVPCINMRAGRHWRVHFANFVLRIHNNSCS